MRREELDALGIHLPALPTIVLGHLPGDPEWAGVLARIGLDVVCSGAEADDAATIAAAAEAAPRLPVKARGDDTAALAAAGARIVEGHGPAVSGAYRLDADDELVPVVDGGAEEVEDLDTVSRNLVAAARAVAPSRLWAAATPGLDTLPPDVVRAKLQVLVDGAREARLAIAKVQFDLD
jgi:hypothetical protein